MGTLATLGSSTKLEIAPFKYTGSFYLSNVRMTRMHH